MRRISVGVFAVIVALILLYFSLRGIDWQVVVRTIRSISPAFGVLSLALGLVPMFLRAVRWRVLLQAQSPVSLKTTFWAVAAGYFGNNFLPARGGELVRSYIVQARSSLSAGYILATALSERVADAVSLILFGAFVLLFTPAAQAGTKWVRGWFAVIGITGALALVILPKLEKPLLKVMGRWPRVENTAEQVLKGVRSLHDMRRLLQFSGLTVAIWSIDAVATTTLARSLHIEMPVTVAMLLIVVLSLSSAIPSTPGYVGVYQFVAVMVLKPFGISNSAAIAFMLVTQAITYLVTSTLGVLAMTVFTPFSWRAAQSR